jgi:hypothetical protein
VRHTSMISREYLPNSRSIRYNGADGWYPTEFGYVSSRATGIIVVDLRPLASNGMNKMKRSLLFFPCLILPIPIIYCRRPATKGRSALALSP